MPFRNPLTGRFQFIDRDAIERRANKKRSEDPRREFYEAILSSEGAYKNYYLAVGELVVKPITTTYEVNADMEIKYVLKRGWIATYHVETEEQSIDYSLPDIDLELVATEGESRLVTHLRRERNHTLVEAKKNEVLKKAGSLKCEVCGFDFEVMYDGLGKGFCEVHHIKPLSASKHSVITKLDDLAILCSNCHRIIHRSDPMLSIHELSDIVQNRH